MGVSLKNVMRWLRGRPSDEEMGEELESHLAMRAEHDGTDLAAARRRLGNVLQTREAMRRVWIAECWDTLTQDVGHGLRLLVRNPSFTLVAGLTLALGIGATSAIFSVLDAVVLAPLPFRDPDRLVWIHEVNDQGQAKGLSVDTLDDWRRESRTLDGVAHALMGQVGFAVALPGGTERVPFEQVDLHTLALLGVQPLLGRWFQPDEAIVQGNTARTVVISYGLWQRLFGGDPEVVGKSLPGWNAGWGETIIGVMPRGFYTHPSRSNTDAWYVITGNPGQTIGRLASGVTLEQAQAELDTMARAQDGVRSGGDPAQRWHVEVAALARVYRSGYAETLYMLLGAVGFVLLIASVNVANLQLNRGVTREAEMATRLALGAGRWRLFRQLVVENSTLALIGGALGVLVALVGIRLFVLLAPDFYPPSEEIGLNATVLLFMLAVCTVTGILSGLVPGLRASKPDIHPSLRQGGRGAAGHMRLGVRRVLVAAEIALAMVLLVGAGLMINSYARAMSVPMGLDPDNVLGMQVSLMGMDRYRTRHATDHWAATPEVSRFYTQVLDRLAALPGVDAVGLTSVLPPGNGQVVPFRAIGGEGPAAGSAAQYHEVSADFFTTLRIPLLRGRAFSEGDQQTTEGVMVVNEAFARRFLDGADPVGQLIQADLTGSNAALTPDRVRQVVGVVGDVRMGLRAELLPVMYVPYRQHLTDYPTPFALGIHSIVDVVVRTSSRPATVAAAVRRIVADVDPDVAVDGLAPMRATLSAEAGAQAFWMRLLGIFAALGVFLAAIGIYGVVSYSVEQRKHEFGIRAALGAHGRDLLTLVLREGLGVTLIGLAVGIGGAFVSTRLIENQLFGVTRMDPMTIVAVALLLLAVSLLACYVPGRRSAKLDPLVALRAE